MAAATSLDDVRIAESPSHALSDTRYHPSDLPAKPPLDSPPSSFVRNASLDTTTARPRGYSTTSSTSLKRKPLPPSASPFATRFSSGQHFATTVVTTRTPRSFSVDSPTLPGSPLAHSETQRWDPLPNCNTEKEDDQGYPQDPYSTAVPSPVPNDPDPAIPRLPSSPDTSRASSPTASQHARVVSESELSAASDSSGASWLDDITSSRPEPSASMSMMFSSNTQPPNLTLPLDNPAADTGNVNKQLPKSPGEKRSPGASKLGSFFGWGGNASPASSVTSFDDKAYSPGPSPSSPYGTSPPKAPSSSGPSSSGPSSSGRALPPEIDIPKANAQDDDDYFADAYMRSSPEDATAEQVDEMEEELKAISTELATSIRREMELEDLVDRLQVDGASGFGRRTSDYFSDSGTSSVRFGGEMDAKSESLEKLLRKTEREKAMIRLELTQKVQEERSRRKELEAQIRQLEEKASQVDLQSMNSMDANSRLRELENTCEDLRRRLNDERTHKENFEDLLTALKTEIRSSQNERDNLRDEVVPQLRARIEGLETQTAKHEKLGYEHSRMQQEMQTLRQENTALSSSHKNRFDTISEETSNPPPVVGLTRSNTISHGSARRASKPPSRSSSLTRSSSVKNIDSRDVLVERVKDIEAQRDALHSALKSLLERQELQNRENEKRIRILEMERDRALATSPRRVSYDREVAVLREEINTLRRRADEAIEQKWQCEKGLSGLKMDLDRAEQEISSLRGMLHDKDTTMSSEKRIHRNSMNSESLEQSYRDLQRSYSDSLDRIKNLESSTPRDSDTEAALHSLEKSLSAAIEERDVALSEADELRKSIESLHEGERASLDSEIALADDLRASAKRVEDLASQVRHQLASNATLRQRLAETIDRGEKEQKSNAARIALMQGKLRVLEEELVGAQQTSEERIASHEEEIRNLKEAHNTQLQRLKDSHAGLKSPRLFSPKTPLSPLFSGTGARSPRLDRTTSGPALSISEEGKVNFLKSRVEELEKALEEADKEMQEVVSRMNAAQIEVMELWNEREEAVRVTRKLKAEIDEERKKGFERRFASLSS